MKTSQGETIIQEACEEVKQLMLIQMIEEQRYALAQTQKEVKSCPLEMIKSLRKEIKSLRTQLWKLQTSSAENQAKQDLSVENPVKQTEDKEIVNNPEN